MVPLLWPVWDCRWHSRVTQATAQGVLVGSDLGLELAGAKPRDNALMRRALLFAGPAVPAPAPETYDGTPLAWVASDFTASPQYGRMAVESLALFAPFGLAALALRRPVFGAWCG